MGAFYSAYGGVQNIKNCGYVDLRSYTKSFQVVLQAIQNSGSDAYVEGIIKMVQIA